MFKLTVYTQDEKKTILDTPKPRTTQTSQLSAPWIVGFLELQSHSADFAVSVCYTVGMQKQQWASTDFFKLISL